MKNKPKYQFSRIITPAIWLIKHLNFAHKFLLLAIITLLSLATLSSELYFRLNKVISTSKLELTGLDLFPAIFKAVQLLQQYRGLSAGVLGGVTELEKLRQIKLDETVKAMKILENDLPANIAATAAWKKIHTDWQLILTQGMTWSLETNFNNNSDLIKQILTLLQDIADKYSLINHPDLETYYLLNTILHQLPDTQENLGQIRAFGTGILAKKQNTEFQRLHIHALVFQSKTAISTLHLNFDKTSRLNPLLKPILKVSFQELSTTSQHIFKLIDLNIIQNQYQTSAVDFFNLLTAAIDKTYKIQYQALIPTVRSLIRNRLTAAKNTLYCNLAIILSMLSLLLYFSIGIYLSIRNNIKYISKATEAFAHGDFNQRILIDSKSELNQIGESFNSMAAELNRLINIEKESTVRIQAIIDSALDALIQINEKGDITGWNHQAERIFGWPLSEVMGRPLHETIIPRQHREAHIQSLNHFLITQKGKRVNKRIETCAVHRDGHEFPIELAITPIQTKDGFEFNAFIRDISERKNAEEKLQLFARVFNDTREGITITDTQGTIIDVNPAFCQITGYSRDEVIGKNPKILSSGKQTPGFYNDMWKTLSQQGYWQGEIWNRKKTGELYAEQLSISSIKDNNNHPSHYVGLFSDITYNKEQQKKLEMMAHYDVLTQLPNRVLLADRLSQAIAHCKRYKAPLAICFVDLDNFKPVNDTYGHNAGDQLLIEVAERIKTKIREEDTVSRLGGDEFVILLGGLNIPTQYEQLLKRLLTIISLPYLIDDQLIRISASIGYTVYPMDNADADTLIRHADQAMYKAKLRGRNQCHFFDATLDQQIIQKQNQLQEIQQAISNLEFCLYYQPKVNMRTGKVFGAEALIRWQHPQKGILPPFDFLPIVEDSKLEIQLGEWVIYEALQQLDKWRKQGIDIEISINISSNHLQSSSFFYQLDKALSLHPDVDSSRIQLEILESSMLSDLNAISNIIKTCRDTLGVNSALDDFGTGYSSLSHLRNLAIDTVKIDQTFVRDMLEDPHDYTIIDGVIRLAHAFHRQVIAEGVETTDHGLMLLLMGCDQAQGYGIARPMPADKFPAWLNNQTPNKTWITYCSQHLTDKQRKIKFFRLAFKQWTSHFENNIKSAPENLERWPIMSPKKCHCGAWIIRSKQQQLFGGSWLEHLEREHNTLHKVANSLKHQYETGDVNLARNGLKVFKETLEKINSALNQHS